MKNENINLNRSIPERDLINKEYKFLKVAHLMDLDQMHGNGDISYSRMVELINELAYDFYVKVGGQNKNGDNPQKLDTDDEPA